MYENHSSFTQSFKQIYGVTPSDLLLAVLAGGTLPAQTFTLKSSDAGGQVTNRQMAGTFGCHGDNVSPELSWENVPAGTQSFAVTIYDKDAPTGSGFWHWVPPGPIHEYLITVYALKTKLPLDKNATAALAGFYMNANTIQKASIVMYAQNK